MPRLIALCLAILTLVTPAVAVETLEGYFIAQQSCEAFQSKNRQTNPGDVMTELMRAYEMIAINKAGGDFFQVVVPSAPVTRDRWVHVSCGVHVVVADTPTNTGPGTPPVVTPPAGNEFTDNLLALSWQPAFCEYRPNKAECIALNDGNLPKAAEGLSIHGLWPQPRGKDYCGVPQALVQLDTASRWADLPAVEIDAETREALDVVMPGTASFLERHEWIKHGTCFLGSGGADEYFDDTLRITDAINASAVGVFLAGHVGATVETSDIRALFDQEFGAGAGDRVQFACKGDGGRVLIQELTVALSGTITETTAIGDLMRNAATQTIGCPRGVLDPAGLQ